MNALHDGVALFIALLAGALAVALIAERLRFPYPIALVVVGAIATQIHPVPEPFPFSAGLLAVFLPALVFEAAWNIDVGALTRRFVPIVVLAVPGVLLTAAIVAGLVTASGVLPFAVALVLGAIVSATDPIATIAVFRRVHVPTDLQTIVECESLANDGIAVALFAAAVPFAQGIPSAPAVLQALQAAWSVAGGTAIGVLLAVLVALLVRNRSEGAIHVVASVLVAYASYLLADTFRLSGIFAAGAAGIAWRVFVPRTDGATIDRDVDAFWGAIAFLANAFIFLQMGLVMRLDRIVHEPLLAFVAVAAVVVARVVLVYGTLPFLSATRNRAGWSTTVALSGMRGALGLALVLTLPRTMPMRPLLIDAVFAVVLVTLVVQGTALEPVLARLRPAEATTPVPASA
jgi:CPA1 family monovalent cation:H+ antiporter